MILNGKERQGNVRIFADLYWVQSACCFGFAIYVILMTNLCTVYGPGLALRGPLGSMVKAVNGMFQEQHTILFTFIMTVVSFALAIVAYFWMTMTTWGALASTLVILVWSTFWYKSCIRILNRFQWKEINVSWNRKDMSECSGRERVSAPITPDDPRENIVVDESANYIQGYLSIKVPSSSGIAMFDKWSRGYYVLQRESLFCYKNKETFELSPSEFKIDRLISLEGYNFKSCQKTDNFYFVLEPRIGYFGIPKLEFRCDTLNELKNWAMSLQLICGNSPSDDEDDEDCTREPMSSTRSAINSADISLSSSSRKSYHSLR